MQRPSVLMIIIVVVIIKFDYKQKFDPGSVGWVYNTMAESMLNEWPNLPRVKKWLTRHSVLICRKVHMFPSRSVVTVMIGRHMESGGGPGRAGDAGALSNNNKQRQLLSPQSSPFRLCHKDLGVATCQALFALKVWLWGVEFIPWLFRKCCA